MAEQQLPVYLQYLLVIIPTVLALLIMVGGFFMFRKFLYKWPKKDDHKRKD
ncbi:DUF2621 family protein [Caldalkalibacillus salinus]|uniref:DUF2621 family protein n=1 Tax=Caldalkalibacillus salinus TaxID=2803787 RepID=UPI001922BDD2|nr:DUF2621 family protein [Caldalkalibacillus salinus]